ncbi:OmpA family protein [Gimibacter soli]|uniref:OmpA family protein n=1 Tax=Gimibacter soli TaxID=3024400 RepID=A0AAE9XTW4_9PROT|nr:OmpA family protein [Gimibacter soli]WCL53313.1 OmpA family protein [Gimibacter soli]
MRRSAFAAALCLAFAGPVMAEERELLSEAAGASIHAFSSEFGSGWEAANLIRGQEEADGSTILSRIWSSASQAPFPHWITFAFPEEQSFETFVFDNYLPDEADHPGISAREIEIWVGADEASLAKTATFELERNKAGQSVRTAPLKGRFLKFVINSNWGHPWYTELGYTRVLPPAAVGKSLADRMKADGKADLYGLYFDFGSARLRPESELVLGEIIALHKADPDARFSVEGHTDAIGSDTANLTLSKARAEAVVSALVVRGAAADAFRPAGFGASQPVADNATDAGRARNRRVTLRLQSSQQNDDSK